MERDEEERGKGKLKYIRTHSGEKEIKMEMGRKKTGESDYW